MHEGQKGHSQLIIAGSDPAKHLELIEKALDQVPFLVDMEITRPWIDAVLSGWNGVVSILLGDIAADFLGAISLISQNIAPIDLKR